MFDPNNILSTVETTPPLGFPGAVDTMSDEYNGPAPDDEAAQNALQSELDEFEEPIEPLV